MTLLRTGELWLQGFRVAGRSLSLKLRSGKAYMVAGLQDYKVARSQGTAYGFHMNHRVMY